MAYYVRKQGKEHLNEWNGSVCTENELHCSVTPTNQSFLSKCEKTKLNPEANTRNPGKEGQGLASCIDIAYLLLTCNQIPRWNNFKTEKTVNA